MEYVVLTWWWFGYSHNKQLAVDVAVGGVGKLVVAVILVLTLVVVASEPQRSRPKKS